ncbi:Tyrosine-protein phosphatase 1,Tyrosine-protein phosphatase non-receptor type 13,Tyrosine-protein phosphatase non-receptor type 7,Tyrosine-protein phosphatase non-receptor type 4 [Mytilus edulis]|uniref:protein-tyrosine-phosphatase n=1 Tax=Mytilus edulis TaxID=6550 RepID=A0A8S3QVP0_MYTED|nr:Tyrosine-protein phosphatase 1,Tyrosine-protein phosphatase non-receptor type 13,Tyrosine-protein phosphatase non-receptor type 7,Tyrosine-protein phosphatase non-receptor type 4 [Mytilus edulis]
MTIKSFAVTYGISYRCKCYGQGKPKQYRYSASVTIGKPKISFEKPQYNAVIGGSVYMTCIIGVTYPPVTKVWWTKGYTAINANKDRYEQRYKQSSPTSLKVLYVEQNDGGEYRCYANNTVGEMFATTTVVTGNIPKPPIASKYIYRIKEGTTVSLHCDPQTSTQTITELWWQRHRSGYSYSNLTSDWRYSGGTLTSPNLHFAHRGNYDLANYTCNVANAFGSSRVEIKVELGKPPNVIAVNRSIRPIRGKTVTLTCNIIVGTRMWWKRFDGRHEIDIERDKTSGGATASLTIRNIQAVDDGDYRCYGENEFGSTYDTVRVSSVGSDATFKCSFSESSPSMQSILWRKGTGAGQIVLKHGGKYVIQKTVMSTTLQIKTVTINDADTYTCIAVNKYSEGTDSFSLSVGSPPRINIIQALYIIKAGNNVNISCVVRNVPENYKYTMYWNKGSHRITHYKYNPFLIIKIAKPNDAGNYSCHVENKYGKNTHDSIEIKVLCEYSTGLFANYMTEVIEGSHTILDCSYDSYPEPTKVYWKKDDKIIKLSESSRTKYNGSSVEIPVLVIHDTTQKDSGKRSNNVNNIKPIRQETRSFAENVELCTDGRGIRDNGLYLNVGIVSSSAMENVNPTTVPITGDNEYYNLSEVQSSCIRVEELKQYIEKKQRQEALKNEYKSIPNVAVHPTTHAQTKENMPKNRFKTTFPYDHTRVILESNGGSDYINANYIDGFEKEKCYIACQGPIKHTVADHWKMIWQENVYQIVMLTNLVEGIKIKCEQYWPSGGKQMVLGNLIIRLNVEKERTAYVTREITIEDKKTSKKRKVTQYHFTAWPDHGTPDPLYLVLFHRHVMSDTKAGHSGPLLVHCSAGIGRTGTYIALDALLEEGRTTGFLDIFKYLKKMRYSRMNMIQTANQYVCLHYTLLEAFTMKDTKIRKDKFSEVWMSISTDNRPVNHQRLDEEFKMLNAKKDEQNQTQHNAAMSTTNLAKNRNKDVLPMDDKRVYLVSYGKGRSDYINAVQVPSYTKFVGYITTQLPLPDTKVDFWTMIRDHISSTIVLIINNKKEADLVYSQSEDNVTIGEFNIKISARRVEENDITEATIDDKPRPIVLFQVICKSIPDPAVLCKLADLISTRATMSNDPITVVSSDGAKNCGLFCAFTNAVSSMQIDNNADIFQLVRLLQLRRPEFFTDFEEYKRCYEALHVHLESANVYANF